MKLLLSTISVSVLFSQLASAQVACIAKPAFVPDILSLRQFCVSVIGPGCYTDPQQAIAGELQNLQSVNDRVSICECVDPRTQPGRISTPNPNVSLYCSYRTEHSPSCGVLGSFDKTFQVYLGLSCPAGYQQALGRCEADDAVNDDQPNGLWRIVRDASGNPIEFQSLQPGPGYTYKKIFSLSNFDTYGRPHQSGYTIINWDPNGDALPLSVTRDGLTVDLQLATINILVGADVDDSHLYTFRYWPLSQSIYKTNLVLWKLGTYNGIVVWYYSDHLGQITFKHYTPPSAAAVVSDPVTADMVTRAATQAAVVTPPAVSVIPSPKTPNNPIPEASPVVSIGSAIIYPFDHAIQKVLAGFEARCFNNKSEADSVQSCLRSAWSAYSTGSDYCLKVFGNVPDQRVSWSACVSKQFRQWHSSVLACKDVSQVKFDACERRRNDDIDACAEASTKVGPLQKANLFRACLQSMSARDVECYQGIISTPLKLPPPPSPCELASQKRFEVSEAKCQMDPPTYAACVTAASLVYQKSHIGNTCTTPATGEQ